MNMGRIFQLLSCLPDPNGVYNGTPGRQVIYSTCKKKLINKREALSVQTEYGGSIRICTPSIDGLPIRPFI